MSHFAKFTIIGLLALVLAACGSDNGPEPIPPSPTSTPLPPGALTVGELVDRINTTWSGVTSYRSTAWTTEGTDFTAPPAVGQITIEEALLPSSRQVTILNNGQVTDVSRAVAGRVYMKGRIVPAAVAPMVDTETWVEVNPQTADSNSPIAPQVAYLLSPIASPFASSLSDTRAQAASPTGQATIEGRNCSLFTFGPASSGEGIAYELAVDQGGLPCRLVQSGGGYANVTTWAFAIDGLTIEAPPVATPPAP